MSPRPHTLSSSQRQLHQLHNSFLELIPCQQSPAAHRSLLGETLGATGGVVGGSGPTAWESAEAAALGMGGAFQEARPGWAWRLAGEDDRLTPTALCSQPESEYAPATSKADG